MLEFLERIAPGRVHVFAYDWRKSPADALMGWSRRGGTCKGLFCFELKG